MSHPRAPYRAEGPFVAREAFTYGDRVLDVGDAFAAAGLTTWDTWSLWHARKIDVAPPPPAAKSKAKRAAAEA